MALLTARQAEPMAAEAAYKLPVRVTSTRSAASPSSWRDNNPVSIAWEMVIFAAA